MKSTIAVICAVAILASVSPVQSASIGFNFDKFGWRLNLPDWHLPSRKKPAKKPAPAPAAICVDDLQAYDSVTKLGYTGVAITREVNKDFLIVSAVRDFDKFVITISCDGNVTGIVPVGGAAQ